MARIVLDQTGDLREGCFYELGIPYSDDVEDLRSRAGEDENDVVALPMDFSGQPRPEMARLSATEMCGRCPLDDTHQTEIYWTEYYLRSLWLDSALPLVSTGWRLEGIVLVSPETAAALRQTSFRGYRLTPARRGGEREEAYVSSDVSDATEPIMYDLQFRGRSCRRSKSLLDAPNKCPYCGHAPLICPDCWFEARDCPRCKKPCFAGPRNHEGESDQRYLLTEQPDQWTRSILEASRWDGSDFIWGTMHPGLMGHFVTKRVVDWLLSIHASPFVAKPALVNVEGADAETLARLEEIKQLPAK